MDPYKHLDPSRRAFYRSLPKFIAPDEEVQVVMPFVLPFSPYRTDRTDRLNFSDTRAIVATDKRIMVLRLATNLPTVKVRRIQREVPRTTIIGEPEGRFWRCDSLGTPLWIYKNQHDDVRMIDRLAPVTVPPTHG